MGNSITSRLTLKFPELKGWIFTKIKDVATNAHPDAMWHLIKESIELKMRKQDPIQYSANVTIKQVEAEIYALKSRLNTLEMKVDTNLHE